MSSTSHINAVSIASPWNNASEPGDDATPRLFQTRDGFIDDFVAGLQAYAPAVNTFRVDIDQVTIRNPIFQEFLLKAADEGFAFILNFTDPNFQNRQGVDADYIDANTADLVGGNDGRDIELDEHFTLENGDWIVSEARADWGSSSEEYDPLDYLVDGWQEVLDWVNASGNEKVREAVYGFELINEPAAYPDTPDGAIMYFEDMTELHGRVDGWGSAKILVGGLRYSGRFDELDTVAEGETQTSLDQFRGYFGDNLVWSAHYYTRSRGEEITLEEQLSHLGDDDVIVTEMNFDADPNFDRPELFATSDGDMPAWAGWTLLQPIFSGQTDKYQYARLAEELEDSGVGMTWWSPIDIDGKLMTVRWGGQVSEERDAIAFALDMWQGNDAMDAEGNGGAGEALTVSDEASGNLRSGRVLFGYEGDDTITGTDTSEYEGLDRFSGGRGYTGHSDDPDNPLTEDNNFMGDKVYAGPDDDTVTLLGGDDFGFGNDGNDTIDGGTGHDVLVGGRGGDYLIGGQGDDVLEGGDGSDVLEGGVGIDLLVGGEGSDTFVLGIDGEDRVFDFDGSEDTIDLSAWGANSFSDLDLNTDEDGRTSVSFAAHSASFDLTGSVLSDANIHFGFHDDTNSGSDPDPDGLHLIGTAGSDTLVGGDGDDTIEGLDGKDRLDGGDGDDLLIFEGGSVHNQFGLGGGGADTFRVYDGAGVRIRDFDVLEDRIELSGWSVASFDDLQFVFDKPGQLYVRHGDNQIRLNTSENNLVAENFVMDAPTVNATPGETIRGTDDDDTLTGTKGDDLIYGAGGNDIMDGGAGDDFLVIVDGTVHRQVARGGDGADTFSFADGAEARLRDFNTSLDRIDLAKWGVESFNDLDIGFDKPGNLFVRHGGNQLRIDASEDLLSVDNFIFFDEAFV